MFLNKKYLCTLENGAGGNIWRLRTRTFCLRIDVMLRSQAVSGWTRRRGWRSLRCRRLSCNDASLLSGYNLNKWTPAAICGFLFTCFSFLPSLLPSFLPSFLPRSRKPILTDAGVMTRKLHILVPHSGLRGIDHPLLVRRGRLGRPTGCPDQA